MYSLQHPSKNIKNMILLTFIHIFDKMSSFTTYNQLQFIFYLMEVQHHQTDDSTYESILSYMQQYDCSYEEAETKINSSLSQYTNTHHLQQYFNQIDKFQNMQLEENSIHRSLDTITMTELQLKNLQMFFSGRNNVIQGKNKRSPIYKNVFKKWKKFKSQMKCLNCLNPRVLWHRFKKNKKQYNNVMLMQHSRINDQIGYESKVKIEYQVMDNNLKQILQDFKEQLLELLETNNRLVNQIKNISASGICISDFIDNNLITKLKPLIFAKREGMDKIQNSLVVSLERQLSIVVVSKEKYKLLFGKVDQFSQTTPFAFCFFNIFGELQVAEFIASFSQDKVKQITKNQMKYIIKNSLFHIIQIGKGNLIKFSVQEHYPYYDYQQEQDETPVEQIHQHKSVREEQDMLYQSMLEEHTTRKKSEELEIRTKNDEKVRKIMLRQRIGEEPQESSETFNFIVRAPNGSIVCRNFNKNVSLGIVYDWISIQEEIVFQDENERKFELIYGYPPVKIQADRQQKLKVVFSEQESKVKLIIRQL